MNEASTVTVGIARPTVRKLNRNELLNALPTDLRHCLVEVESAPCEAGLRRELVGWVAQVQGRSTGALLCVVFRTPTAAAGTSAIQNLARRFRNLLGARRESPLLVELLDVLVESETDCATAAHALLGSLVEELQRFWEYVPVVVPESDLTAQVFFRNARYKAVRVLRGYYGDEDGYLMTDEIGSPPQCRPAHSGWEWKDSFFCG